MPQKEDLAAAVSAAIENPLLCRSVIAFAAALSFLLPWLTLDGNTSATTGANLAANLFHGTDRGHMFDISFKAALAILTLPFFTLILTAVMTFKTVRGHDTLIFNFAVIALLLLTLIGTGPLASTSHQIAGKWAQPQWGIILLMLTQTALIGHSLWTIYSKSPPGRYAAPHQVDEDDEEEDLQQYQTQGHQPQHPHQPHQGQTIGTAPLQQQPPAPAQDPNPQPERRPRSRMPAERRQRFSERMVNRATRDDHRQNP